MMAEIEKHAESETQTKFKPVNDPIRKNAQAKTKTQNFTKHTTQQNTDGQLKNPFFLP